MTRKHFQAIANAIASARAEMMLDTDAVRGINTAAYALATELRAFNPAFDRQRFLTACGVSC